MHRCIKLALLANGNVAPNPMVGAVLVYNDKIIGEGYHRKYGEAHAEVECITSVKKQDRHLIAQSVLYVSLEPCAHFGKTPPCVDLIIENKIQKVFIGCRDPFEQVNGKGIEKLIAAGVDVTTGILEKECKELNKTFLCFHTQQRPYVILKWAETMDGKIANNLSDASVVDGSRLFITNNFTNRIVHKWRSETMAILVGTNTALQDDPELTTRLWPGNDPIRLVIDLNLRLPGNLKLFTCNRTTIVFNLVKHSLPTGKIIIEDLKNSGVCFYRIDKKENVLQQIMNALYFLNVQSLIVEGGASTLQSFIEEGLWDEARVITNEQLTIGDGLQAPILKNNQLQHSEKIFSDVIHYYKNAN